METEYRTVYSPGSGEYEEKKSRFLSEVHHVRTEEEMLLVLNRIRKKHYDARHHCYACVLGKKGEVKKSSDDGEPSGTAGHPILSVIEGAGLTDTLIVVTRYFGGTLLGTGGLVRSYTKSAKDGLLHAVTADFISTDILRVRSDYTLYGKIRYFLEQEGLNPGKLSFTETVEMTVPVPVSRTEEIEKKIRELSAGRAEISRISREYSAEIGGKTVFLRESEESSEFRGE